MAAIAVEGGRGPASALHAVTRSTPRPGRGEILVRVAAAGVNRPDLLQRMGAYPPPPGAPDTLGLEVAGEVAAVGEGGGDGAPRWRVGDAVAALLGGGGYAEYAVVDARHTLPAPAGLSWVEAAALPETVFTVFANVWEGGRLQPGETLLVHGATSGIGVTAIQMARAYGARVIATGRGADKAQAARGLGADLALDASAGAVPGEDWVAAVREAGGADVVLDMVAGAYFAKNMEAANTGGRIVHIAFQGGATVELNIQRLMAKRLVVTGSTLRPRSADEKARLAAAVERTAWPWAADGRLRPPIDRTFPLEEAAAAHAHLEAGAHVGKVVLVTAWGREAARS